MAIAIDEITDEQLQRHALNPAMEFKGEPLWPFHRACRTVLGMLYTPGHDVFLFEYLALVWLLRKRGGLTAEDDFLTVLRQMDRDPTAIRSQIMLWRNDLSEEDEKEAAQIARMMLGRAKASEPILAPQGGKKKQGRNQPKPATSLTSAQTLGSGVKIKPSTVTS